MSEQAVALLHDIGYSNVRDYREGLADWVESGGLLESAAASLASSEPSATPPELQFSVDGVPGRGPARVPRESVLNDSVVGLIHQFSTLQLFMVWIATVVLCGLAYWTGALLGDHGLLEGGAAVGTDVRGLGSALYFSFVTATSLGYGDIVPVGVARVIAVTEAVAELLIFGAVIAKFVSHHQDELVREIHRITFDERLDRVQSNLHSVILELLSINNLCETRSAPMHRIATQLDSAVLLFLGELRATHDLLYQPRLMVEEGVLAGILAELSSALEVLAELLACLPPEFTRSQPFEIALHNVVRLSAEICGNCVPHAYTPRLTFWMDRIQNTSHRIR